MFYKLYTQLQAEGYHFANDDELNSAVFAPPEEVIAHARDERSRAHLQTSHRVKSTMNSVAQRESISKMRHHEVVIKLKKDLNVARDRANRFIKLVTDVGSGVKVTSDAFLDEVDFLSQCQLRIRELVEAGTTGLLDESAFSLCLDVNGMVGDALRSAKRLKYEANNVESDKVVEQGTLLDLGDSGKSNGDATITTTDVKDSTSEIRHRNAAEGTEKGNGQADTESKNNSNITQNPFDMFGADTFVEPNNVSQSVPQNQSLSKAQSVDDMFDALFEDRDVMLPPSKENPAEKDSLKLS